MSNYSKEIKMSQEIRIISSIKAARSALGWSQPMLSEKSGVSIVAIARLEAGMASSRLSTISRIKTAFESAGIRIADDYPPGGYTLTVSDTGISEITNRIAIGEDDPQ